MIYLFTYEEIKQLDQARRNRSMAAYRRARDLKPSTPTEFRGRLDEGDVIELVFGSQCECTEPMGA